MARYAWRRSAATALSALDELFASLFCSPLGPVIYLLTAPLAELHFYFLVRRFASRRAVCKHATHSLRADAAEVRIR